MIRKNIDENKYPQYRNPRVVNIVMTSITGLPHKGGSCYLVVATLCTVPIT